MKKAVKIASIAAAAFAPIAAGATSALSNAAAALNNTGSTAGFGTQTDLPTLIGSFINIFLGLLGVIFVVLTVYAGYLWMTAAGDEKKVDQAKNTLTRAVIGIIIVVASYAIAQFVVSNLATATA